MCLKDLGCKKTFGVLAIFLARVRTIRPVDYRLPTPPEELIAIDLLDQRNASTLASGPCRLLETRQ